MPPRIGNKKENYYKRALRIIELRDNEGLTFGQLDLKFKLTRSEAAKIYHRFKNREKELLLWLVKRKGLMSTTPNITVEKTIHMRQ